PPLSSLVTYPSLFRSACRVYQERRDVLVAGLRSLGYDVAAPKATFYVWLPVEDSMAFAARLLDEAAIVATPGVGFGEHGEGFVRDRKSTRLNSSHVKI